MLRLRKVGLIQAKLFNQSNESTHGLKGIREFEKDLSVKQS